ncbi:hypothetical protein ACFXK0_06580 [Nocardia sp. NPDC059177]|uniref:hypothetical protein n=1 Tax=Nocardia sp. NPDC059177 TaxID=3346759 RepID=UPI0036B8B5E9
MTRSHRDEHEERSRTRAIDLHVWREVTRIRTEWIVDHRLTPAQRHALIDEESVDLTARITVFESVVLDDLVDRWKAAYGWAIPDDAMPLGKLTALARADARSAVLCDNLYAHIPPALIAERHTATAAAATRRRRRSAPPPQRWRSRSVTIAPATEMVVMRTWGIIRSCDFTELACALIQVQTDDGMPIPASPLDPLAEQMSAVIHDQLVEEGLPPI